MSSKYRRGGLGRGLGALIPTAPPDEAGAGPASDSPAGSPPDPDENSLAPDATGHPGAGGAIKSSEGIAADPVPTEATAADPADPTAGAAPGPTPVATTGNSVEPAPDSAGDASDLLPVHGARFVEVPVADIRPNPRQPRQVFDEDALAELTHSIREFGVLQPVVVRDISGESGGVPGGYELVMGERRLRAAVAAGLAAVPAIVRTTTDDAMLRDALLENIHRSQLNPLEEAAAYQQLLEEFGATHDELAGRIGRSRPQVSNTIRLLNLPVPVQRRVAAGVLSAGHARALLSVDDTDVQEDLAGRIVAEGLSVRATEELVALHAHGHQTGRTRRKAATPRITAPALAELAERLSDAFDTRVKVELGRSKGKITVEFATIDDLERIVSVMSGHVAADARARAAVAAGEIAAGSDVAAPGPAPVEPEPAEFAEPGEPVEAGTDTPDPSTVPGPDYAGWGSGHVSDPGAWSERPENGG